MSRRRDLLSMLFLLLAIVAVIAFVVSYWWHGEWVVYQDTTSDVRLLSNRGNVTLQRIDPPGQNGTRTVYPAIVSVSYLAIALVTLIVPTFKFSARRLAASRRRRAGKCADCGYDLRVSGDTCPECGERR